MQVVVCQIVNHSALKYIHIANEHLQKDTQNKSMRSHTQTQYLPFHVMITLIVQDAKCVQHTYLPNVI